jgi:VWFA-related protein
MGTRTSSDLARRLVFFLAVCLIPSVQAQQKEKPKLRDFGESLERLKWDDQKKATVETRRKPTRSENNSDEVVRVETSLVVSDVLVLDSRGRPVQGLNKDDFVISEEAKPQTVGMVSLGDKASLSRSIVLIMDYSCMQLPFLRTSVAAAKTLIDRLGPADRMAIVTDDVEVLVDYTNNKGRLSAGLDVLLKRATLGGYTLFPRQDENPHMPIGRGLQFSALMAVLKEAFDDEDVRPIIIFQTQGSEAHVLQNPIPMPPIPAGLPRDLQREMEESQKHLQEYMRRHKREFSLNDLYKAAETSRATIYTVTPGFRLLGLSSEEQMERMRAWNEREAALPWMSRQTRKTLATLPTEILKWQAEDTVNLQAALATLSTITGGWIEFLDQPTEADEIYSRIFSDITRRYLVGYYPTNKYHDGKRRRISITVRNHPEYVIMGRKAYYAPGPEQ